jgi:hypothetical protein
MITSNEKEHVMIQQDYKINVMIHQMITPNEKESVIIKPNYNIYVILQASVSFYLIIQPNDNTMQ